MAYIAPKDFSQDPELIEKVMRVMGGDLDLSWMKDHPNPTRVVASQPERGLTLDDINKDPAYGPASIPDYLARVGDAADRSPGIPRWGAKASALVLQRYEHLEQIPDDAAEWEVEVRGASGIAASLAERRPEAALYKKLATLRLDVPLEESLDQLEWRGVRRPDFRDLCDELGLTGLGGDFA